MLLEDLGVRPGLWDSGCSYSQWRIISKAYMHQENCGRI